MAYHKVVSELMDFSINSYYIWKKENRPIISLLQQYFTEDDLREFLDKNMISKLEYLDYSQEEIFKDYFHFIVNLNDEELLLFLTLIKENKGDLVYFSHNLISIILDYNSENRNKVKLIENYSKVKNKSKLLYFGMHPMLKDKFRDFYTFSINYSRPDKTYNLALKHIKAYLQVFENKDFKTMEEYFPELKSLEHRLAFEHENQNEPYPYQIYEEKYFNNLLKLL